MNALHASLPHMRTYLEIGLSSGHTFEHVTIPRRVGVDPVPRFDISRLPHAVDVFVMTSDEYFASPRGPFDLVFVDGLHTFRQTYRDIVAALNACPLGAVLVDDVVPGDEVSAIPDQHESLQARRRLGMPGAPWHGDVFRSVLCLDDHHPELAFRTIVDGGNPQLLVWHEQPVQVRPVSDAELAKYASVTFADVFASGIPDGFRPGLEVDVLALAVSALHKTYG